MRLLGFSVEREGPRVALAVRDDRGSSATLELSARGAACLAVNLAAAAGVDEDFEAEFRLRGDLTAKGSHGNGID